jgi:hypothetical protein
MKRLSLTVVLTVIVIALLAGLGVAGSRNGSLLPAHIVKDKGGNVSDFSAVFLTNGQVYFGQLYSGQEKDVDLRDIYYLQVNQQVQPTTEKNAAAAQPDIQLVKLGDEIHGPVDRMRINRDQVLFIESLKTDSKVVKAISNYVAK